MYYEKSDPVTLDDCEFYQTIDLPVSGLQKGPWDLRAGIDEYLGSYDFRGKTVLEIGTANGFCCFHMESQGAHVVAVDLSPDIAWDVVPYHCVNTEQILQERRVHNGKLNNAWWLAHSEYGSNAKVVYSSVYDLPQGLGMYDVGTCCLVLPHLRDPVRALEVVARHVQTTMIVVGSPQRKKWKRRLISLFENKIMRPGMYYWPDPVKKTPWDTYWMMPEGIHQRILSVLGFSRQRLTYHTQLVNGEERELFTIVADRR